MGLDVPRRFAALTATLGLSIIVAAPATAQDDDSYLPGSKIGTQITVNYGNAKPPSGFLALCKRLPENCEDVSSATGEPVISPAQWATIDLINRDVNRRIASVSDRDLYGQEEFWAYPTNAGDCEDYVLEKRRQLVSAGIPAATLLITVVLDEHGEGHAVLTVSSAAGDYILDNRRNEILHWSAVNYKFLKRQSPARPSHWVALAPQKPQTALVSSGNSAP